MQLNFPQKYDKIKMLNPLKISAIRKDGFFMSTLKGACIIGQSGGPTAVINTSAQGAIEAALKNENITRVLGAEYGIRGVLEDRLFDMSAEDPAEIALLRSTPASDLGSCRYKLKDSDLDDTDYKRILEIFKKYDVRYFFYNGGNDSMDTCNKISKYMLKAGWECRVMGIPKTVDNDLFGTDHCPGFGSAAKYIATSAAEISRDAQVYGAKNGSVIILEIMGRNAGWLTAAAALANTIGQGPDLVYLPEVPFEMDKFLADVGNLYKQNGNVLVAVSEGVRDKDGKFISEYGTDIAQEKDAFGHSQMGGLAGVLVDYVKKNIGCKTRGIEFSLLQRCAMHCASATDIEEAYLAGAAAVEAATAGHTDKMVAFSRPEGEPYRCDIQLLDLSNVANAEKMVPREWINEEGNGMTQAFIDYALPLIAGDHHPVTENGLPRYAKLRRVLAK